MQHQQNEGIDRAVAAAKASAARSAAANAFANVMALHGKDLADAGYTDLPVVYETDDSGAIEEKERILSNLVLRHNTWLKANLENKVAVVRLEDKAKVAEERARLLEDAKKQEARNLEREKVQQVALVKAQMEAEKKAELATLTANEKDKQLQIFEKQVSDPHVFWKWRNPPSDGPSSPVPQVLAEQQRNYYQKAQLLLQSNPEMAARLGPAWWLCRLC